MIMNKLLLLMAKAIMFIPALCAITLSGGLIGLALCSLAGLCGVFVKLSKS